ncbi:MAG: serine hydrolase [Patescibacteria group bacterium]|jgi:D-alanyl-D-alanine carboxypeptidase
MFFSSLINFIFLLVFGWGDIQSVSNLETNLISLKPSARPLEVTTDKSAVLAADGRFFLQARRADEIQSIASITKLMTALVFLDHNPGWDKVYEITAADNIAGGRLNLFLGERVTIRDLFYTSLVASDNGATIALVHATGLSDQEFVAKMNDEARRLGLVKTRFSDPIGLSDQNVSTAREVAYLAQAAFNRPEIQKAASSREYQFTTELGVTKKVESTDYLLFDPGTNSFEVVGGKTGFTDRAGYCFVGRFKNDDGREVISVVLNSQGKNERFRESKALINWVFDSYNWIR